MKDTLPADPLRIDQSPVDRAPAGAVRQPSNRVPQPGTATLANPEFVCVNGAMVPYADATIHVSSVAAKYGANVFEGLCAYAGEGEQSFLFRVSEHLARLGNSVRMMQIECDYGEADYLDAILMSLRENQIRSDAHIRLTVFITGEGYSDGRGPASLVCIAKARTSVDHRGVHAAVSTWRRIDDSIMPPRIKAGANYHNSRFGLLEARRNGYDQVIFLTMAGKVSEGANASFAMVRNGILVTPPVTAGILESVTRSTLLEIAADDLGLQVQEREIDRTELYVADEAFFCGSGQEMRPVLSVDGFPVGDGRVGPVTRRLWNSYEAVIRGQNNARAGWLTPVWEDANLDSK
jgi:branched-chain amino acid aminotransferase